MEGLLTFFFILMALFIFFHDTKLDQKQIATFFVCPNIYCKAKHQPKSFIDSKDENINRHLMTCKSCSQKGHFELVTFHQFKCDTCHNVIKTHSIWFSTKKGRQNSYPPSLNPCPHCNTYGAKTYVPELSEKERGIQYSSKKNGETIFILIIIAMIVFFLTLVLQ